MALHDLKKKVKKQVSDFLEMPGDIMMDLPKITMVGDIKLYIENHRGIIEYSSAGVRVSVMEGEVSIAGKAFCCATCCRTRSVWKEKSSL
jgi:sporulation protein YqfC